MPFLAAKAQTVEYLRTKQDAITWSTLITGPFFDWGLKVGFLGFNLGSKKVTLWDGGEAPFAATNLRTIGQALVNLLSQGAAYEKATNQVVHVASHVVTQKQVQAAFEKATGGTWEVQADVDVEARVKEVNEKLAGGDYSSATDLLLAASFGKERRLGTWPRYWNEELGLEKEEDLERVVREVVEGVRP